MPRLILDPGHGGYDPGAIGPTGLQEKNISLDIAKRCGKILSYNNIDVAYTRETDIYMGLSERTNLANKDGADYFISIHINSAESAEANGTESFALSIGGEGQKLAECVQKSLVENITLADRGVKFANFAVLRKTDMPAMLVEVCFISNPLEEVLLRSSLFLDKVAEGIAKGFLNFIGQEFRSKDSNVEDNKQNNDNNLKNIPESPTVNLRQGIQWTKDDGKNELPFFMEDEENKKTAEREEEKSEDFKISQDTEKVEENKEEKIIIEDKIIKDLRYFQEKLQSLETEFDAIRDNLDKYRDNIYLSFKELLEAVEDRDDLKVELRDTKNELDFYMYILNNIKDTVKKV